MSADLPQQHASASDNSATVTAVSAMMLLPSPYQHSGQLWLARHVDAFPRIRDVKATSALGNNSSIHGPVRQGHWISITRYMKPRTKELVAPSPSFKYPRVRWYLILQLHSPQSASSIKLLHPLPHSSFTFPARNTHLPLRTHTPYHPP
jgi:hypothetical protein